MQLRQVLCLLGDHIGHGHQTRIGNTADGPRMRGTDHAAADGPEADLPCHEVASALLVPSSHSSHAHATCSIPQRIPVRAPPSHRQPSSRHVSERPDRVRAGMRIAVLAADVTTWQTRTHLLCRVLKAIFCVLRPGCPWRCLPSYFPLWQAQHMAGYGLPAIGSALSC
jgi:hypothetical protein